MGKFWLLYSFFHSIPFVISKKETNSKTFLCVHFYKCWFSYKYIMCITWCARCIFACLPVTNRRHVLYVEIMMIMMLMIIMMLMMMHVSTHREVFGGCFSTQNKSLRKSPLKGNGYWFPYGLELVSYAIYPKS